MICLDTMFREIVFIISLSRHVSKGAINVPSQLKV